MKAAKPACLAAWVYNEDQKGVAMMRVIMLVQTMYKNQLLREGGTYEIPEETAARWIRSKIAKAAD